jgi:hypothetical protein
MVLSGADGGAYICDAYADVWLIEELEDTVHAEAANVTVPE